MRNTLKHLTLLTRMKDDGLLPALTGSFSEDAIAQACGQVETLQLQERLHIRKTKRIQEELIRVPNFAALYDLKFKEVNKYQHKRALALTARKLVRLVFRLLKDNRLYIPSEG